MRPCNKRWRLQPERMCGSGGVATIRQYLEAELIDVVHLAISPVLLGSGEHLLTGIDLPALGYECTEHVSTAAATHVVLTTRRNS